MKKQFLLLALFLSSVFASAQNCNFSYTISGAFNAFDFAPNPNYSPNLYSFLWDFGDGTTSTNSHPTHIFNSPGPLVVCYTISDTNGVFVCSACDTLSTHNPGGCSFTVTPTSAAGTYVFSAVNTSGGQVEWDFGDGSPIMTGHTVTYSYSGSGSYLVCMAEIDTATQVVICISCQPLQVGTGGGNCSFIASSTVIQPTLYSFVSNVPQTSTVVWDFGDGSTGSGLQATHNYTTVGTFLVCMTATDTSGFTCHDCQVVYTGGSNGNCYFTYRQDSANVNSFTFDGLPAYPNSDISWDFGDGHTATGNTVNHAFAGPGSYHVCMIETDSIGNIICSDCQTITIGSINNCQFIWSANPMHPLTVDFITNASPSATVTWDFGDGSSGTGGTANHSYASAGTYNVCVTISSLGVTCTSCMLVTVGNTSGHCQISFYPDPFHPNVFQFDFLPSTPGSSVDWDFDDGSTATGNTVSHTFAASGIYVVCATESDSSGQIVCQTCVTIQAGGSPPGCQASFLATNLGLTAYFIDLSLTSTAGTVYSWDFGDGSTSNNRFPQHTYNAPGTYNACLTITSGNCTDTYCSAVVVDTGNVIFPGGPCRAYYAFLQLAPYQVTVVNLSSGLNLSFNWDFGDGTTATGPYPSHVYTSTGSYNLCLTVSDANGCSDTFCDTLSVDTLGNIFRVMTGFTVNVLSPGQITAGVEEVSPLHTFSLYPNPASDRIHFSVASDGVPAEAYSVMSIQGGIVSSGTVQGFEGTIDASDLASGVYLIVLQFNDGSRSHQRIIKN